MYADIAAPSRGDEVKLYGPNQQHQFFTNPDSDFYHFEFEDIDWQNGVFGTVKVTETSSGQTVTKNNIPFGSQQTEINTAIGLKVYYRDPAGNHTLIDNFRLVYQEQTIIPTTTASSTGSGGTTSITDSGLTQTTALAEATGGTTSIDGSTTMQIQDRDTEDFEDGDLDGWTGDLNQLANQQSNVITGNYTAEFGQETTNSEYVYTVSKQFEPFESVEFDASPGGTASGYELFYRYTFYDAGDQRFEIEFSLAGNIQFTALDGSGSNVYSETLTQDFVVGDIYNFAIIKEDEEEFSVRFNGQFENIFGESTKNISLPGFSQIDELRVEIESREALVISPI